MMPSLGRETKPRFTTKHLLILFQLIFNVSSKKYENILKTWKVKVKDESGNITKIKPKTVKKIKNLKLVSDNYIITESQERYRRHHERCGSAEYYGILYTT